MRRPVNAPYTITTEFGVPDSNALFKYHSGVDYGVGTGTNIYAPIAGTVVYAQFHSVRGNMVGIFDGTYTHRLMHNSAFKVKVGDKVTEGQIVALSGSTGLSTGPHCHWDIVRGNKMDATSFNDFLSPADWLATPPPTPKPIQEVLEANQRRVRSDDSINYRKAPNTTAEIIDTFPANDAPINFKGWVTGESVEGNNVWFVGALTGGFCWSGGFTDASKSGLPDLNAPAPSAPVVPAPAAPTIVYSEKPSTGIWAIDVSSHQKTLDFVAIKEQGVQGVVIKAGHTGVSYGGNALKTDSTFVEFQKGARDAGLAVGYYWYCYFDEDAETEAGRFVQSVGLLRDGEPLFADIEEVDGASKEWLVKFLDTVEDLSGKRCHIYTYANYLQTHLWIDELLGDRKLWLAHYDVQPGAVLTNGIETPVMHQYTSKGVLRGVGSQYIDLNVYFDTITNFKKLGDKMPVVTPNVPQADPVEPAPNNSPPAPLPTPSNNPVRVKVKWGAYAGIVVSFLVSLAAFIAQSPELATASVSAWVTVLATFITSYLKKDGYSPE